MTQSQSIENNNLNTVMQYALDAARGEFKYFEHSANSVPEDIPVGAVVIDSQAEVVSRETNCREAHNDPFSHAEIEAMRSAAENMGTWNLSGCTLVVTLEPCPMCAGAAVSAHIGRIVFGAWDPKMGACGSVWDIPRDPHVGAKPEVIGGVREEECSALLKVFFQKHRA